MYFEFIRELMLCLKVVKRNFLNGGHTPLNHNEAVLIWFLAAAGGSPYILDGILDQDPAQVYRNLKKLEEMNLVKKEISKKKANYILTDEGREIVEIYTNVMESESRELPDVIKMAEEALIKLKELRRVVTPLMEQDFIS